MTCSHNNHCSRQGSQTEYLRRAEKVQADNEYTVTLHHPPTHTHTHTHTYTHTHTQPLVPCRHPRRLAGEHPESHLEQNRHMPVPGLSRNRDAADLTHGGRSLRGGRGRGHTHCGHHSSLCHRPGVPQPEGGREEGGEEGGRREGGREGRREGRRG